jgi:hypothetical protein
MPVILKTLIAAALKAAQPLPDCLDEDFRSVSPAPQNNNDDEAHRRRQEATKRAEDEKLLDIDW